MRIALVGNPNVGKTTLFNTLTGLRHTTGNYPGVTVERKVGKVPVNGQVADLVDLPGTYSLAAQSPDEMIVFDVLVGQQPGEAPIDAILAVVDATNLDRNLYLVSQLRDLEKPVVVALNMMDLAVSRKIEIDCGRLNKALDMPVVPISAHRGEGIDTLRDTLSKAATAPDRTKGPAFPSEFVAEVESLTKELNSHRDQLGREIPWQETFRVLVDRDGHAEQRILRRLAPDLAERIIESRKRATSNGSLAAVETRSRYQWIREALDGVVRKPDTYERTLSDRIDGILTHPIWGTLVFALVMGVIFQAIYTWSAPFMDLIEGTFVTLGGWTGAWIPEGPLRSLIADGLIAGLKTVGTCPVRLS